MRPELRYYPVTLFNTAAAVSGGSNTLNNNPRRRVPTANVAGFRGSGCLPRKESIFGCDCADSLHLAHRRTALQEINSSLRIVEL